MFEFILQQAQQLPQVTPPAGMTVDQFVAGTIGAIVPFLVQLIRNHVIEVKGWKAVALSAGISLVVTAVGYFLLDPTRTLGEFLTNAGLCFATAQAVYNTLSKAQVSNLTNAAVGLPSITDGKETGEESKEVAPSPESKEGEDTPG